MNMDLPEPYCGDWAKIFDAPPRGQEVCSWKTMLSEQVMKQYRAGYYGCINHIDDQIGRVLMNVPRNTIVLFVSDHGEMLGDHQWIRKRSAYEGSARVPFVWKFPAEMGVDPGQVRDEVVELMDVMPTLLDAAGCEIPEGVDGSSLLPLLQGRASRWREYVHGECASVPGTGSGQQWLVTPTRKYIWHPGTGVEQYFDLENDPLEMHEVSGEARFAEEIEHWRGLLIKRLEGRPEGFSDGKELQVVGGDTPFCLPGYEQQDQRL
jgi:arylsulfatase A-like enzyme